MSYSAGICAGNSRENFRCELKLEREVGGRKGEGAREDAVYEGVDERFVRSISESYSRGKQTTQSSVRQIWLSITIINHHQYIMGNLRFLNASHQ